MRQIKTLAILTMALTSIAAHAEDATLGSLSIDRGFAANATIGALRQPDAASFKITGFFTSFSWTVLAGTRIPQSQVRAMQITIRGKKLSGFAFLSLQNVRTNLWDRIRVLDLPAKAFGYTTVSILQNASNYVGNGGKIRVRVDSLAPASFSFDYLKIGVFR